MEEDDGYGELGEGVGVVRDGLVKVEGSIGDVSCNHGM